MVKLLSTALGLSLLGLLAQPSPAQTRQPAQGLTLPAKLPVKPESLGAGRPDFYSSPLPALQPASLVPVNLVLDLSDRQLYLYRGEAVAATYPVAVGKPGWETPTGSFTVSYMLENPGWTNPFTGEALPPGPDNPLGERWIAFWTDGQNEIGFHGTPNRASIGQAASHGCVRLYNEHIRELYEQVQPGTLVTVVP